MKIVYKLKKPMPGLGEGGELTKFTDSYNREWYHDEFDRIRLSAEIVENNYDCFEQIKSK